MLKYRLVEQSNCVDTCLARHKSRASCDAGGWRNEEIQGLLRERTKSDLLNAFSGTAIELTQHALGLQVLSVADFAMMVTRLVMRCLRFAFRAAARKVDMQAIQPA
ncbi:hypothetical protein MRB53_038557 [Persea americana]|nr:hypothetical protein MRB53_038557 [Persea americana]